jgi:hypothetical protein
MTWTARFGAVMSGFPMSQVRPARSVAGILQLANFLLLGAKMQRVRAVPGVLHELPGVMCAPKTPVSRPL